MADPKSHPKAHAEHPACAFVRAGGEVVNLAHVVRVSLPVDGDPKKPLTVKMDTGENVSLVGDDADAFLEALGAHCDVAPEKPAKKKSEE